MLYHEGMKNNFILTAGFIVLLLVLGLMLLPMPHGGTFGGNMIEHWRYEIGRMPEKRREERENARIAGEKASRHRQELSKRFSQTLSYRENPTQPADQNWKAVTLDNGYSGLLDVQTGMIWGGMMKQSFTTWTMAEVKSAMADCATMSPAGGWALPTAAELDLAKVHGLIEVDSNARHKWLTYIDSADLTLPAARAWGGQSAYVSFRCVGRSESAPAHGYGAEDVDNETTLKALGE